MKEGVRGEGLWEVVCRYERNYIYNIVPGSFAFMTRVPIAIAILLEKTVSTRPKTIMTFFVLFSNFLDKRFARPIYIYCHNFDWQLTFVLHHDHLSFHSVYMFCCGGKYFCVGIFFFSSRSIRTSWFTFKVCSQICF